jgi:PAS domain S-box-containing protein
MVRLGFDPRSLSAQMILSFVVLVLLTAVAIGVPAIWMIHNQLERQAWAQVEQGRRATRALYEARQGEIRNLATLTAQRPTLRRLLTEKDASELEVYLGTLRAGAGIDVVFICDSEGRPVVHEGELIADTLCAGSSEGGFQVIPDGSTHQAWLFAMHPIDDATNSGSLEYSVVVGTALNDLFAAQMRDQTGLEHTVLVDGEPVATSLTGNSAAHESCQPVRSDVPEGDCQLAFAGAGEPYFAVRIQLSDPGLEAEAALPVSDVVTTERHLVWMLVGSIVIVAIVGSGVGALLARRIGRPLARLADAAAELSKGDLSSPVPAEVSVREVALVAEALEGARADLERTLDQLRREKAWSEHLLEAIVEGIVTLDSQGRITFFSHGAERITGWTRDQAMGLTCDQIFQPLETDEPFTRLIPPPGRRQRIAVELRQGRQAVLAITVAPLLPPDGGDAQVAMVFRDVSETEAIHRLLGHFLANVTHEFRSPLAAVAASVELLLDQAADLSTTELNELLTSLHLGVLGLQTLVDNLLESASIEAGHFHVSPRPSNLGEIIAEAIRSMQPILNKHGQHLVVDLPAAIPVARADPRRTVQVLVNLLSNASKYGPDEAEITITAEASAGWVRLAVADRGSSIPPEERGTVFHRFVRPTTFDDGAQHGAGLGLSVVSAIVEAHGGQVGVDDRPGGGSVFWFTLPRVREG